MNSFQKLSIFYSCFLHFYITFWIFQILQHFITIVFQTTFEMQTFQIFSSKIIRKLMNKLTRWNKFLKFINIVHKTNSFVYFGIRLELFRNLFKEFIVRTRDLEASKVLHNREVLCTAFEKVTISFLFPSLRNIVGKVENYEKRKRLCFFSNISCHATYHYPRLNNRNLESLWCCCFNLLYYNALREMKVLRRNSKMFSLFLNFFCFIFLTRTH